MKDIFKIELSQNFIVINAKYVMNHEKYSIECEIIAICN